MLYPSAHVASLSTTLKISRVARILYWSVSQPSRSARSFNDPTCAHFTLVATSHTDVAAVTSDNPGFRTVILPVAIVRIDSAHTRGTRQNDGLETGMMGATAARLAWLAPAACPIRDTATLMFCPVFFQALCMVGAECSIRGAHV